MYIHAFPEELQEQTRPLPWCDPTSDEYQNYIRAIHNDDHKPWCVRLPWSDAKYRRNKRFGWLLNWIRPHTLTERALMLRYYGLGTVPLYADGQELVKGVGLALSVLTLAIEGMRRAFKRAKAIGLVMGYNGWIGFAMKSEDAPRLRAQLDEQFQRPFFIVHTGDEEIDIRQIPDWPLPSYRLEEAARVYKQACLNLWQAELEDRSTEKMMRAWAEALGEPYKPNTCPWVPQNKPEFIRTRKVLDKLLKRHTRIHGLIGNQSCANEDRRGEGTGLRILSFGEVVPMPPYIDGVTISFPEMHNPEDA